MLLLLSLPPSHKPLFLVSFCCSLYLSPLLPLSSQRSWPKPRWPLVCLVTKGYHESEPPKIARNVLSQSSQPFPTDSHAKIALPLLKSYPGDALPFRISDQQSGSQQVCFHYTTSPASSDLFHIHMETLQKMLKKKKQRYS